MLGSGKRDWLARTIVAGCRWLARRSVRLQLLFEDIGGRLFLDATREVDVSGLEVKTRYDPADLVRRTDELNAAAEEYFVDTDRAFLRGKPFTERRVFARRLFDLGVLFHWLRITPGEVVLEIGAGSCWLSHLLNRFGCKTIAVDVSASALDIGRELFESDQHTNWALEPEFIAYDGHVLPLEDGSVDKIIVYDAFHHIPNVEQVLGEMARVLRDGGIIGMREPGRHHAGGEQSLAEVRQFGVLENNVIVEELEALGRSYGLDRATVIPVTLDESIEVPVSELPAFLQGKALRRFWEPLRSSLVDGSYLLLYKGEAPPDSRRPQTLSARIAPRPESEPLRLPVGRSASLEVEIENTGDTLWLADTPNEPGWTRLGIQLYAVDGAATLIDGEWQRVALPHDVAPDATVVLDVELPAIEAPGDYLMRMDMVAEDVAWFAEFDSPTAPVRVRVVESDT